MPMNREAARVVDSVLSKVAHGFVVPDFVGSKLFPEIPMMTSGGKVIRFGKEAFIKYQMRRAPGAKTARVMYGYASDPISLVQDSLEGMVPREWMRDTQHIPNLDQGATAVKSVMQSMLLGLEVEQAALAQNPDNYASDNKMTLDATNSFLNPNTDTKKLVTAGKESVRSKIGMYPNTLVIPANIFSQLDQNVHVRERLKYTSAESVTAKMLANYYEVDEVVVAKSVSAADEDADLIDVWTEVVLAYVPKINKNQGTPSFGYTYYLEGHPLVERPYYDDSAKSHIYSVEYERAPYLTAIDAGFIFINSAAK